MGQTLGLEAVGVLVGRELGGCVFATVSFFVVSTLMNRLGPDAAVVMRPGSDSENPDHVSEQDEEHKVAENIHHEKHQHDFLSYFAANFGDGMVCSSATPGGCLGRLCWEGSSRGAVSSVVEVLSWAG